VSHPDESGFAIRGCNTMKLLLIFLTLILTACGTTDFMVPDVKVSKQPNVKSGSQDSAYLYAELTKGDYDEIRQGIFIYTPATDGKSRGQSPQEVIFDLENPVYTENGIMYKSIRPIKISSDNETEVYTRMEIVKQPDPELGETIGREIIIDSPVVLCAKTCQ